MNPKPGQQTVLLFFFFSLFSFAQAQPTSGGVFRMNETEDFRSLYPPNVIEKAGHDIAMQVYEGLLRFDPQTLQPEPALARKWETDDTGLEYTFTLRSKVRFHDDPCFENGKGKKLTAADVKWCFDQLCRFDERGQNQNFQFTFKNRVAGAGDYYEATKKRQSPPAGVAGIEALNDSTLRIRLAHPDPSFPSVLCTAGCWIYPKEAFGKYGQDMRLHAVGTGPFQVESIREGELVMLTKNTGYWGSDENGNRLPYLDKIKISFIHEIKAEALAFKNGELDLLSKIPLELIPEIIIEDPAKSGRTFQLLTETGLNVCFFGFQHQLPPFNNVLVRRAFCLAINRNLLTDSILQGEAVPALSDFVPPGISGYEGSSESSYKQDVDSARKLLQQAGYPGGRNFPSLSISINSGGAASTNTTVAEAIRQMLYRNLGVEVTVEILPFAEHLDRIAKGKSLFWRSAWLPDYPDASCFLDLFYGKNVPESLAEPAYGNSIRYRSSTFDRYYESAMQEANLRSRNAWLQKAEETLMADAAVCPLYFQNYSQLVSSNVRGYCLNAMAIRDLRTVWFRP